MTEFSLGLMLAGYGLAGVFCALLLLYGFVKLFSWVSNKRK